MSKWMLFGFLLDEAISCVASLNTSKISCHTCFMAASLSGLDVGRSNLFLFFALVYVGCTSDQIWKARCKTFFLILGRSKFNSSSPLRRTFMSSSVESLVVSTSAVFFSGVNIDVWTSVANDCICSSTSCCSTFSLFIRGNNRST